MSKLGVGTYKALTQKKRLIGEIATEADWQALENALIKNHKTRTKFLEQMERLDSEDVNTLLKKHAVQKRFVETQNSQTFNGFIKSGAYKGYVKYRVDPALGQSMYTDKITKAVKTEYEWYTEQNAFDFVKMKNEGIIKDGFFKINELDDAINIYNTKNLAANDGEIIFVKKTDGTTILSPRRGGTKGVRDDLPHPYLSGGEDVMIAGAIRPGARPNELILTNKTGHFKVGPGDETSVVNELKSMGYNVDFDPDLNSLR